MCRIFILVFSLVIPALSFGLSFKLPGARNNLVGKPKVTQVKRGENFSDVAERFDVGYYEILEANPGIDPDKPPVNTALIVPTQYILPDGLKKDAVIINLAEMRLYYRPRAQDRVFIFPVGIGKENWNTPEGEMKIVRKKEKPSWNMPKSIYEFRKAAGDKDIKRVVPPGIDNPLGDYALYLSERGYLIHGTNIPSGVGRRSTAGCIRLYPRDIKTLFSMVNVGTSVRIINQPYKAGWYDEKLYFEARMPLFEQRLKTGGDIKQALDVVSLAAEKRRTNVNWKEVEKVAREHLTVPRVVGSWVGR